MQALARLRAKLQPKFLQIDSDDVSISIRLPSGEKVGHKFHPTCSTMVSIHVCSDKSASECFCYILSFLQRLYEFVFCVGRVDQCFQIVTTLPRHDIQCREDLTIQDCHLDKPSTVTVEYKDGDIIALIDQVICQNTVV